MSYTVAVAGASGYAGGELLRLLSSHPDFVVTTVTAHSNAGQPLIAVQPHLRSLAHLSLVDTTIDNLLGHDVVFLALPHGASGAISAGMPICWSAASGSASDSGAVPSWSASNRSSAAARASSSVGNTWSARN